MQLEQEAIDGVTDSDEQSNKELRNKQREGRSSS